MTKEEGCRYMSIWGDTVDFKPFIRGIVLGAVCGFAIYYAGEYGLKTYFPSIPKGLMLGYALLIGAIGSIATGVVTGILIQPKRKFVGEEAVMDKRLVLRELNLDLAKEEEYMDSFPPEIIQEMKKVKLYSLFKYK